MKEGIFKSLFLGTVSRSLKRMESAMIVDDPPPDALNVRGIWRVAVESTSYHRFTDIYSTPFVMTGHTGCTCIYIVLHMYSST